MLNTNISSYYKKKEKENNEFLSQFSTIEISKQDMDFNKLQEVLMTEGVITESSSERPVLATYGAGPCVIVGGYNKKNSRAFLTHFTANNSIDSLNSIVYQMKQWGDDLEIVVVGGSQDIKKKIEILKKLKQIEDLNNKSGKIDIKLAESTSLAVDSRTGKFTSYNPNLNPESKKIIESMAMMPGLLNLTLDFEK